MASAACTLTSPALADSRVPARSKSPIAIGLPSLPPPPNVASQGTSRISVFSPKRLAQNVVAMATGEAPAQVATQLPEFVKTIQEAWNQVEDKYAVSSLAFAAAVGLWGSAGMISAIDRLPVVPGVLELVGIGYSGWFAYQNLVYKPDREALLVKIKCLYRDIIGSS
ncbi:Cyanobacterial aminoacyl-tRNA synthetase CAAD domain-containing protein [Dioscorea alata]|uniref:Cyanobacterial aminoacyl-tRNA synthetase CAAD domain-containing protein n=1 Tax=Dioscorea alata TaxID=55571 RepID=A0ACB7UUR4_DIOAL|nr:Cyanobacterial aminoacyl-tRNA synthetase CAAD domain-containing protein [Dioscorea alata]